MATLTMAVWVNIKTHVGIASILILLWMISLSTSQKVVQHACLESATNADTVTVNIKILPNNDPVYRVYGFDATQQDTTLTTNRIDACMYDTSGITDPAVDTIDITLDVDTSTTSYPCGATVTDEGTYKKVTLLFRVYAYSETFISAEDDVWRIECRTDDLTGTAVMSEGVDTSATDIIDVLQPQTGTFLRVRDSSTLQPVTSAGVGDNVLLSLEFTPTLEKGPDNYGTLFYIGFLGNDPISAASSLDLHILIKPRYSIRTDVTVTASTFTEHMNVSDGTTIKVQIPAEYMGCSDSGTATVDELGIEIDSHDLEVSVLVCNIEADTADCYTALPTDVTGNDYYSVSVASVSDVSELMIVAHEDSTVVDVYIPPFTGHSVQYNGNTFTSGQTLQITLNKRQTICIAQTTERESTSHVSAYHITTDKAVTVVSGNRKYENDHVVDQIPPTNKLGTDFVLIPANPVDDGRTTTYLVLATQSGDTIVKRYTSESAFETVTIGLDEVPLTLEVAADSPCELTSDKAILVAMVSNNQAGDTSFEHAMVIMPSTWQWTPSYPISNQDYTSVLGVVVKSGVQFGLELGPTGFTEISLPDVAVKGPSNYVFRNGPLIPAGNAFTVLTADRSTSMVLAFQGPQSATNLGIAFLPPGYRYTDPGSCYSVGRRGDLLDNDCDGTIDEELVDQIDNDGDGRIDEDTVAETSEYAGMVAIRPTNCRVSGDVSFTNSYQITTADGCAATGSGPFIPGDEFTAQTGTNIGGTVQHKVLYSGVFELAMFVDSNQLVFSCDIAKYCYSVADTDCTTNICQPGVGKREVTDNRDNVTTLIYVVPLKSSSSGQQNQTVVTVTETNLQNCMDNTNVQLLFSSLLLAAALSFTTALCFCVTLRGQNNRRKRKRKQSDFQSHTRRH